MRCDAKKVILDKILEYSGILFNNHETSRNNMTRHEAWQVIHGIAIKLGTYSANKNWTYMRDVVWQNLRKSTLTKLSMKSKGKQVYLDICDKIIIQVLDIQRQNHHLRNSKRTNSDHDIRVLLETEIASSDISMKVPPSDESKPLNYSSLNSAGEDNANVSNAQVPADAVNNGIKPFQVLPIKEEPVFEEEDNSLRFDANTPDNDQDYPPLQPQTNNDLEEQTEDSLRQKYLKLQIRNLQIVNYKEMLQVIKLERELGIARTELPKSFNFNL